MQKVISSAVIKRLPRYYRYLDELRKKDVVRISSKELSERMNVTASQIRQDLNNFGGFGQQGYGYNVEFLYNEIGKILGIDLPHTVIIIGAGNIGRAIANYDDFPRRGFQITAIFDVNPELIGTKVNGILIRSMEQLQDYILEHRPDIAALTVPKEQAPAVAADVTGWGIKAIWNFAPTELFLSGDVVIENVHLTESLMRLSYKIRAQKQTQEEAETIGRTDAGSAADTSGRT